MPHAQKVIRIKAHDQNAALATQRLRSAGCRFTLHGLETGAEIATKHVAPRQQLIDGAVDGRAGNSQRAAPRSENRHPDDASLHVHEGAALGPLRERAKHRQELQPTRK